MPSASEHSGEGTDEWQRWPGSSPQMPAELSIFKHVEHREQGTHMVLVLSSAVVSVKQGPDRGSDPGLPLCKGTVLSPQTRGNARGHLSIA